MKSIQTFGDLLSTREGKMRHFDDGPTTEWIKGLTKDTEQRLRSEGWVPIEERTDLPA
jgi:hypothetical protein